MTAPSDLPDDCFEALHGLVHAALNGRATPSEQQRLEELIVNNEEARLIYLKYVHDSVALRGTGAEKAAIGRLPLAEQVENSVQIASSPPPASTVASSNPSRWRCRFWTLSVTASAVVAVAAIPLVFWGWSSLSARYETRPAAKIVQAMDASWSRNGEQISLKSGDWLPYGRYVLAKGVAQIVFPWGTEVTLEGPTEIELAADGAKRLVRGQLVAKVSEKDTTFTIDTPTVEVIDLGTEFGISAAANGDSEVHVFKGAVEARQRYGEFSKSDTPLKLDAGEATIFGHKNNPVRQILYNPNRFVHAWSVANRVAETTGGMRFIHPPPKSVLEGKVQNDREMLLFLESEQIVLQEPTPVTIAQPGYYTTFNGRVNWLQPGLEVDSYLVHIDRPGPPGGPPAAVKGAVSFDRPILAVIACGDQQAATDAALGAVGVEYAAAQKLGDPLNWGYLYNFPTYYSRGLSGLSSPHRALRDSTAPNDWIRISEDRRTLTLSCTNDGAAEQIRILVAAGSNELPKVLESATTFGPSRPFRGVPFAVGATIEAEDYDLGGDGIGYYDNTPDLLSSTYRTLESVELRSFEKDDRAGTVLCNARAGEWVAYTVEVPEVGTYVVKSHIASRTGGGRFRVEFGESIATESQVIPLTDPIPERFPLDTMQTIESTPVTLEAGTHVMRVVMETNNEEGWTGIFDWFRLEPASSSPR
ncbi:hypothetical protein AYO47_06900 [Planctomyces sp. SCGC AG-212-M04]|nr:hypothetical protein AYO47_06900 [Planctomyces sp. SCGC AG-212-M04]